MSTIVAWHLVQDTTGQRTLFLYDHAGSRAIRVVGEMCERKLAWWMIAHPEWRVKVYDDRPYTVIYGERKAMPAKTIKSNTHKWHIKKVGHGEWVLEQEVTHITISTTSAHCTACALTDAIARYGGSVDLRGLYRYGHCYSYLASLVYSEREDVL